MLCLQVVPHVHLRDDDSALEGWPVTLTFAVGKSGNVALHYVLNYK